MEINGLEHIKPGHLAGSVLTIGNFDGVHLGHKAIFQKAIEKAGELGLPSAAITFEPHPREVLNSKARLPSIFTFKERARLIEAAGIDELIKVDFTLLFAARSAESFMSEVELKLNPRAVVIGHDFRFGRGREGDGDYLRARGGQRGYEVETMEPVIIEGKRVSSSLIRELIESGRMAEVAKYLGRRFYVQGNVIEGHGRGKTLGFATANLRWKNQIIPPDGVYAAYAHIEERALPTVVNIGTNPTFEDEDLSIEAHILDYDGDIYSESLELSFAARLRNEIKFDSPEALIEQIKQDVAEARKLLAGCA